MGILWGCNRYDTVINVRCQEEDNDLHTREKAGAIERRDNFGGTRESWRNVGRRDPIANGQG